MHIRCHSFHNKGCIIHFTLEAIDIAQGNDKTIYVSLHTKNITKISKLPHTYHLRVRLHSETFLQIALIVSHLGCDRYAYKYLILL